MAISKRHARTAVERSRVKRLVRETFRQQRATLPVVDVVVMLRSATADTPNAVLRAGLERLWGLLQERSPD
jgi:ribonuclease P protein component